MAVIMKGNLQNTLVRQRMVNPINYLNTIVCLGITGPNEQNQGGRPIASYNCGKPGNKRPYCPQKVNRVATYNKINLLSLEGAVGNNKCMLTLDSGAQITVVNGSLVNDDKYTGESIELIGIGGQVTITKLAVVKIKTEKFTFPQKVVVIKTSNQEVLIGLDVVHFKELWRIACIAQEARHKQIE